MLDFRFHPEAREDSPSATPQKNDGKKSGVENLAPMG
jgi:hypothetical protein